MLRFDFEENRIKLEISKLGAKRVLLQLPEGLKPYSPKIAEAISDRSTLVITSADPCYGACDLAVSEAEDLGVDLIVHFGHAKMVKHEKVPTIYVEAHTGISVEKAIEQAIPIISKYNAIGLATSVQHLHAINQAKEVLSRAGKTVVVGESGQIKYPGQVTGCNYSNAKSIADKVEAFLFVGGGMFHALGIALSTNKPTIIADPYDDRAYQINDAAQTILKQRFASIQEAKKAERIGVFIGLKPGQKHLKAAFHIKALAEKKGMTAYLLAAREITPEMLLEFPSLNAYVNTACPRVSVEATGKFGKPLLTVNEFRVVCGEVSWENMLKEGLFEN